MKTIVLYTSKYGSTEKYAQWIADALGCKAAKLSAVTKQDLAGYDTVIYGGGLYASGIGGFKNFLAKLDKASNKQLVLFMVGLTNPERKDIYDEIAAKNIPADLKGRFKTFALRGDQLFSKMSGMHKLMMRVPKMAAEKIAPRERTEEDKQFIEFYGKDVTFASKEQITALVEYVKSM